MFASKSLREHLVRGAIGAAALVLALLLGPTEPLVAIAAVAVALVALRGCPTCWTIGLAQTLLGRGRGARREETCVDGRCPRKSEDARDRR